MNLINLFFNDFKVFLPEIFFSGIILALLMYGVIYSPAKVFGRPIIIKSISWLAILTCLITILLIINNPFNNFLILKNLIIVDNLTIFIKVIVLLSTIFTILMSLDYIKSSFDSFEYIILILLAVLGMLLIVSSYDFIGIYLAIELQSLSLYILAAFKRNYELSTEAGLKYFVLGALSSGVFIFGASFIYGSTGITNLGDLAKLLTSSFLVNDSFLIIGVIFILVSLLFKMGGFPFHMWLPDVYQGAPTSVTAFFAIVPKFAIIGLSLRLFLDTFYNLLEMWQSVFIFSSLGSMVIGVLGALYQQNIKRFFAYSAISHIGYILIGICSGTIFGIQGLLLYMFFYIVMNLNIFSIILSLRQTQINSNIITIKNIDQVVGLFRSNSVLAITFALILFSIAGIPPLAGFYSKFFLFLAAIESELYLLAIVSVIFSVIAAFYYIRFIRLMFFSAIGSYKWILYNTIDREKSLILGFTLLLVTCFFIYPYPLLLLIHKVSLSLSL